MNNSLQWESKLSKFLQTSFLSECFTSVRLFCPLLFFSSLFLIFSLSSLYYFSSFIFLSLWLFFLSSPSPPSTQPQPLRLPLFSFPLPPVGVTVALCEPRPPRCGCSPCRETPRRHHFLGLSIKCFLCIMEATKY